MRKEITRLEGLALELERMAERATPVDHVKSPIVDMIAAEPGARPFWRAIERLVATLTTDGRRAPDGSIVTRLVRDSDLGVASKLELLFPLVWRWVKEYPKQRLGLLLPSYVGERVRDDCLEPLDVIEHWLRKRRTCWTRSLKRSRAVFAGREPRTVTVSRSRGMETRILEAVSLSLEVETRILEDLKEAWQRGAQPGAVAHAVDRALRRRSDEECSMLGLDEMVLSLAGTLECQEPLMSAAMAYSSWGTVWATRIVERVAALANADDRKRYVYWFLAEGHAPDAWANAAIERLRAVRSVH